MSDVINLKVVTSQMYNVEAIPDRHRCGDEDMEPWDPMICCRSDIGSQDGVGVGTYLETGSSRVLMCGCSV